MTKAWVSLIFILAFFRLPAQQGLSAYVLPFIGTDATGHTYPGATMPFGMVQLSPDTRINGSWEGCSGYHYSDSVMYGFSHTHLNGTGCSDYGDILFVPTNTQPTLSGKQYKVGFNHKNEFATAGYYSVILNDQIKTELTTTTRVGFHRYTFPENSDKWLILDLSHRDKTLETQLNIVSPTRIEGMRRSEAWAKDQHIYFVAEFSEPFEKEQDYTSAEPELIRRHSFKFNNRKPLLIKVGISTVSIEGAGKNLETELKHWDFNKVKNETTTAWDKELGKIEVKGGSKNKLEVFYTALYHTMLQPNVNMDVDGHYRGMDNKIHLAKDFTYYSVFSLWDTYRAAHPLYTIIDKKRSLDFIQTFLTQYEQGGRLPVWELAGNETNCMIGYHCVSVISDAYLKGIKKFNSAKALEAMQKSANETKFGIPSYIQQRFLTADDEHESVSKTLEYAYDDWCIAQMANAIGDTNLYQTYLKRATSYKNLYDKSTGFMRPLKNGNWLTPFDAYEVNTNFTEANSWQYSFYTPQDIGGLIQLHGGKEKLEKKLDELFSTSKHLTGNSQEDITGLIGQYAHGNEPSHHLIYLYYYLNKPFKTQGLARKILTQFYNNTPNGLIGNEDCGQMSAWYVLSAMGMYQVCPGNLNFCLGTPLFKEVKLNLENGKSFCIKADKDPSHFQYLKSVNNTQKYFFHFSELETGSTFNLQLDSVIPQVNISSCIPLTEIKETKFVPLPLIIADNFIFINQLSINLKAQTDNSIVYYTLDGSLPNTHSLRYSGPFFIDSGCVIKAICITNQGEKSNINSAHFHKKPNNWTINILSPMNKTYHGGGPEAIIDGWRGEVNWRKGFWQGYQGTDFEAIVDLKKIQAINCLSVGCNQDLRAWILLPKKISIETSIDGINFSPIGEIENNISEKDYTPQIKNFILKLQSPNEARFVKIKASNFGKLPQWHLSAGNDAYIFIDEIEIK